MNYKEFTETIKDKLTGTFGSGYRVYAQEVLIGNGQKRIGICVLKDGERPISPVIYLEKYYAASRSGETMEDIMPRIVDEIKAGQENAGICFRVLCGITDWDFVKDSIYPFLLSRDRNEEMCRVYAGDGDACPDQQGEVLR
ncbi:MAG: DUF5688 family protein [Clostridiales bacterium]|nr:DUF5688 family protein [Clostridiales bacterium]